MTPKKQVSRPSDESHTAETLAAKASSATDRIAGDSDGTSAQNGDDKNLGAKTSNYTYMSRPNELKDDGNF